MLAPVAVRNVALAIGGRTVLRDLNFDAPSSGPLCIVGPARAGKSALCRLLSGHPFADGDAMVGSISFHGTDWRLCPRATLLTDEPALGAQSVLAYLLEAMPATSFVEIASRGELHLAATTRWAKLLLRTVGLSAIDVHANVAALSPLEARSIALARASASDCPLICIDDATLGLADADRSAYLALVRTVAEMQPVLFATSDEGACSALGGAIVRLDAGTVVRGATSITAPSNVAALFAGESPGFQWIIAGSLAGMSRPGLVRELDDDIDALVLRGVTTVVTLEEQAVNRAALARAGIEQIHYPIGDMRAPDERGARQLARDILTRIEGNERVAVHCRGGQGRTGTILAAVLIERGHTGAQSIELLRSLFARYIESDEQLAFVQRLGSRRQKRALTSFGVSDERLSTATIDDQPFGVVRLDHTGKVLSYNVYEERLASRSRADVIGKNFFRDVAPCTGIRRFYGRFLDGVARGSLDTQFRFRFTLDGGVRLVQVAMFSDDDAIWVLIRG
jgi:photoactive yellow protein